MVKTYAVIVTHNRHDMLENLVNDLRDQVHGIVVIDHKSTPPVDPSGCVILRDDGEPNIQRLWNRGLDAVHVIGADDPYNVLVLNDDVHVRPGAVETLAIGLRTTGAAISSIDKSETLKYGETVLDKSVGPKNLFHRMAGYCYMLRGELELRLNEKFVWWYGDDDLEWRACGIAGVARVGGDLIEHLDPNGSTNRAPELAAQTSLDRTTFIQTWGKPPW